MKSLLNIAIATILFYSVSYTQSWSSQVSNVNDDFKYVYFIDNLTGWAAHKADIFDKKTLKTTNGGSNWSSSTTNLNINDIKNKAYLLNSYTGWVVGESGSVEFTNDGGTSWTTQLNISNAINDITFVSDSIGYIIGNNGIIYKTTNQGNSWLLQNSGVSKDLEGIGFKSLDSGIIIGDDIILFTIDGGITWTDPDPSNIFGYNDNFEDIYYIPNSNIAYAVGKNGVIKKSVNFGSSWTNQVSGTSNSLYGVHFISETEGWAVGNSGTIRYTNDGGTNWVGQTSGVVRDLLDVFFYNSIGWAVGKAGTIITINNPVVLPINLSYFKVDSYNKKYAYLTWATSSEKNNNYFIIERSHDLINWQMVVKQNGIGNSNSTTEYFTIDKNPLSGTYYYRLKQVDINGDFKYLKTISFKLNNYKNDDIKIFPNPYQNEFTLNLNKTYKSVEIIIYDSKGKLIYSQKNRNISITKIKLDAPKGHYFIDIITEENKTNLRLAKE